MAATIAATVAAHLAAARLFFMRRWFAIILLALLPLQFSWAAIAAYCGHESDAQAQHSGHHEYQQDEAANPETGAAQPPDKVVVSAGLDCGQCHGCCAALLLLPTDVIALLVGAARPVAPAEGAARTLAPSPPERPQWAPLA